MLIFQRNHKIHKEIKDIQIITQKEDVKLKEVLVKVI